MLETSNTLKTKAAKTLFILEKDFDAYSLSAILLTVGIIYWVS